MKKLTRKQLKALKMGDVVAVVGGTTSRAVVQAKHVIGYVTRLTVRVDWRAKFKPSNLDFLLIGKGAALSPDGQLFTIAAWDRAAKLAVMLNVIEDLHTNLEKSGELLSHYRTHPEHTTQYIKAIMKVFEL